MQSGGGTLKRSGIFQKPNFENSKKQNQKIVIFKVKS